MKEFSELKFSCFVFVDKELASDEDDEELIDTVEFCLIFWSC